MKPIRAVVTWLGLLLVLVSTPVTVTAQPYLGGTFEGVSPGVVAGWQIGKYIALEAAATSEYTIETFLVTGQQPTSGEWSKTSQRLTLRGFWPINDLVSLTPSLSAHHIRYEFSGTPDPRILPYLPGYTFGSWEGWTPGIGLGAVFTKGQLRAMVEVSRIVTPSEAPVPNDVDTFSVSLVWLFH